MANSLTSFLGEAAGPPAAIDRDRRVTLDNPGYVSRTTFPVLEAVCAEAIPAAVRDTLQYALAYVFDNQGLHLKGIQICETGTKDATRPECIQIDAERLPFPFARSSSSWVEFPFHESAEVSDFGELTAGVCLTSAKTQIGSEQRYRSETMDETQAVEGAIGYTTACLWLHAPRHPSGQKIFSFRYVAELVWTEKVCHVFIFALHASSWCYPIPSLPEVLGYDKSEEARVVAAMVVAAVHLVNDTACVEGAGPPEGGPAMAAFPLMAACAEASEGFRGAMENGLPIRMEASAWTAWTHDPGRGRSRLFWQGRGVPPEPPVPAAWLEYETDPDFTPGGRTLAAKRIGVYVKRWDAPSMREAMLDVQREKNVAAPFDPACRDRWYLCALVALGVDGKPHGFRNAVALGYGSGLPVRLTLSAESGVAEDLFGMPAVASIASSEDTGETSDDRPEEHIASALVSAMSDPTLEVRAEEALGGYVLRFPSAARPDDSAERPGHNWPDFAGLLAEIAAQDRKQREAVHYTLAEMMNRQAVFAARREWAYRFKALRPGGAEDYATPDGERGLSVMIIQDVRAAMDRSRAKAVPFDPAWPKQIADVCEGATGLREEVVMSAYFGTGPKHFRPTAQEVEAFAHTDLRFPQGMYRQPFDVLTVEFPKLGENYQCYDERGLLCWPVGLILYRPDGCPGLFIDQQFSSGLAGSFAIPIGLNPLDETEVEEMLGRVDGIELSEGIDARTAEQMAKTVRVSNDMIRVGINAAMLLVSVGCKRVGPAKPGEHAALSKHVAAKNVKPEVREASRSKLIAQPIVYGFHQTIKVYDEGTLNEPQDGERAGYHVKPHWRRGCWVNQPHGPRDEKKRKLIFRKPVFVNEYLFGGTMTATNVTLVRVPGATGRPMPTGLREIPDDRT